MKRNILMVFVLLAVFASFAVVRSEICCAQTASVSAEILPSPIRARERAYLFNYGKYIGYYMYKLSVDGMVYQLMESTPEGKKEVLEGILKLDSKPDAIRFYYKATGYPRDAAIFDTFAQAATSSDATIASVYSAYFELFKAIGADLTKSLTDNFDKLMNAFDSPGGYESVMRDFNLTHSYGLDFELGMVIGWIIGEDERGGGVFEDADAKPSVIKDVLPFTFGAPLTFDDEKSALSSSATSNMLAFSSLIADPSKKLTSKIATDIKHNAYVLWNMFESLETMPSGKYTDALVRALSGGADSFASFILSNKTAAGDFSGILSDYAGGENKNAAGAGLLKGLIDSVLAGSDSFRTEIADYSSSGRLDDIIGIFAVE